MSIIIISMVTLYIKQLCHYYFNHPQEIAALQEGKQLLIKQKLDLQSRITEQESALSNAIAEHEETKEVDRKVQTMLRDEVAALQTKMVKSVHFVIMFGKNVEFEGKSLCNFEEKFII